MENSEKRIVFTAHVKAMEATAALLTEYAKAGLGPHKGIRLTTELIEVRTDNVDETRIDLYFFPTVVFS